LISSSTRELLAALQVRGIKLGLDKVRRLLARLDGSPPRAVQVAGTNGKGSVVFGLEAIALSRGLRVGTFTSPHLIEPTERIRIGGRDLDAAEFDERAASLAARLERWSAADPELAQVTHFEFLLALAIDTFVAHRVELAILEVGMGGRLDATTAVPVQACAITSVALDHQRYLGPDLTSIAGEKAGIARAGVPLLVGPLAPEAARVVEARAAAVGAPLRTIRPVDGVLNGMWGEHQRINAALSLALAGALGLDDGEGARRALAGAAVPARCQRIDGTPELLIDGAHNPHAAAALGRVLARHPAAGATDLLVAAGEDKDAAGILVPLLPFARRVHCTAYRGGRVPLPAAALAATAEGLGAVAIEHPDAGRALDAARAGARPGDRLVVAGSLFLAGEVLARVGAGA